MGIRLVRIVIRIVNLHSIKKEPKILIKFARRELFLKWKYVYKKIG